MVRSTLGNRLRAAMLSQNLNPASLARLCGSTEATVSNWLNDNVSVEHVKAVQLFKIADAVKVDPRELLLNESSPVASGADAASHPLQPARLTIAIQLVTESLESKSARLPPEKQSEAITLAYELLEEGMPRAKVLRFVRAAVA